MMPTTTTTPFDFSPANGFGHRCDRALAWYGLTPLPTTWCPRRAVGKRHLTSQLCICRSSRLLDHPHLWRTAHGRIVYTAEPYGIDPTALADLDALASPLGLTTTVYPMSMWNPGVAVLLVLSDASHRRLPLTFRPSSDLMATKVAEYTSTLAATR